MRVINQHQEQIGVIATSEALALARDAGLDLVEVSPNENPPVCRIVDYGRSQYEKKKRLKQSAGAHQVTLKEIRLRPKTDIHDLAIKLDRANRFLDEGHKVQFTMLFRGRERFHRERAYGIFTQILKDFGETVKLERSAAMDGRRMTMLVAPGKRANKPAIKKPSDKAAKKKPVAASAAPELASAAPGLASAAPGSAAPVADPSAVVNASEASSNAEQAPPPPAQDSGAIADSTADAAPGATVSQAAPAPEDAQA